MQRMAFAELESRGGGIDGETLGTAARIVEEVRAEGEAALRRYAQRFGEVEGDAPMVLSRARLALALEELPEGPTGVLKRTTDRIRRFARAQREGLSDLRVGVPGGEAGVRYVPVQRAGCYAPGGRYPLPSSVLMTVVTAREAGVQEVWVASPRPTIETLAAAALGEAAGVLALGGAHAVAALAFGAGILPPCDVVVGPGNRWVTAAKKLVAGEVAIDMLAGPSELLVLADGGADPELVAADLLAQAEHDPDAVPGLVCTEGALADAVEEALGRQLQGLPTAIVAERALSQGFVVVVDSEEELVQACDRLSPEHVELHLKDAPRVAGRLRSYGASFVGSRAAEVFGDYGVGPNHVLPTGGSARSFGALSVLTFLRAQTWLRLDDVDEDLVSDVARLARMEGLEAHARAAERRGGSSTTPRDPAP